MEKMLSRYHVPAPGDKVINTQFIVLSHVACICIGAISVYICMPHKHMLAAGCHCENGT